MREAEPANSGHSGHTPRAQPLRPDDTSAGAQRSAFSDFQQVLCMRVPLCLQVLYSVRNSRGSGNSGGLKVDSMSKGPLASLLVLD